jgi:hypothetical protein
VDHEQPPQLVAQQAVELGEAKAVHTIADLPVGGMLSDALRQQLDALARAAARMYPVRERLVEARERFIWASSATLLERHRQAEKWRLPYGAQVAKRPRSQAIKSPVSTSVTTFVTTFVPLTAMIIVGAALVHGAAIGPRAALTVAPGSGRRHVRTRLGIPVRGRRRHCGIHVTGRRRGEGDSAGHQRDEGNGRKDKTTHCSSPFRIQV